MQKIKSKEPSEIKALLEGPVNSIPTSFLRDGGIDWNGVANIIETGIAGGSGVSLLTAGDSQLLSLSDSEVAELTRFHSEKVAGRALTVAATGLWWTGKCVEFARHCRDLGVDVLMTLPPSSATEPDGLVAHYKAIADVMPVMLVGYPSHAVLDRLIGAPNICCFKEDGTEAYSIITIPKYAEHWKFMTGGCLWRHLIQWPYGCRSFMAWSSCFAPQVSDRYWRLAQANDMQAAGQLVQKVEFPLFDLCGQQPGGALTGGGSFPSFWQGLWRAALELRGIASRYLRPPMLSATDADMENLRQKLAALGLSSKR